MAYNNQFNSRQQGYNEFPKPQPIVAMTLPTDYVDKADQLMQLCNSSITTSKLRNLMGLLVEPYNDARLTNEATLNKKQQDIIQGARIRMVYECARDDETKKFVKYTNLLSYLMDIKDSRQKLIDYYHYMEALVAYGRYHGTVKK